MKYQLTLTYTLQNKNGDNYIGETTDEIKNNVKEILENTLLGFNIIKIELMSNEIKTLCKLNKEGKQMLTVTSNDDKNEINQKVITYIKTIYDESENATSLSDDAVSLSDETSSGSDLSDEDSDDEYSVYINMTFKDISVL